MIITPRFEHRKKEGAKNAKDFEKEVQAIWTERSLDKKRTLLLAMIEKFKYKDKIQQFQNKVSSCNSCTVLDTLAGDILLYGNGLAVVK